MMIGLYLGLVSAVEFKFIRQYAYLPCYTLYVSRCLSQGNLTVTVIIVGFDKAITTLKHRDINY